MAKLIIRNYLPIIVCITILFSISIQSCSFFDRLKSLNTVSKGFSRSCRVHNENDTAKYDEIRDLISKYGISKYDTIFSIGAGSGKLEFLISCFADSITFYLEDIDTSCLSKNKIESEYFPHYSKIKGRDLTCQFIPVVGTVRSIDFESTSVDKIIINKVFHHFEYDSEMLDETYRLLRSGGMLFINENVLKRNRKSWKFCTAGGYYKTEEQFVKDVVDKGFILDTIYRGRTYTITFPDVNDGDTVVQKLDEYYEYENWREFVFIKP